MKLSKNFDLYEFLHTGTGLPNETKDTNIVSNLIDLTLNVLQPVRDYMGTPARINSGYRSLEVNKAVGGAKNSQHMFGQAADISFGSRKSNLKAYNYIIDNILFDQIQLHPTFFHVSFSKGKNRKQIL